MGHKDMRLGYPTGQTSAVFGSGILASQLPSDVTQRKASDFLSLGCPCSEIENVIILILQVVERSSSTVRMGVGGLLTTQSRKGDWEPGKRRVKPTKAPLLLVAGSQEKVWKGGEVCWARRAGDQGQGPSCVANCGPISGSTMPSHLCPGKLLPARLGNCFGLEFFCWGGVGWGMLLEMGSEPPVTGIPETDPERAGQGLHSLRREWRRRPGKRGGDGCARHAFPAPEPSPGPCSVATISPFSHAAGEGNAKVRNRHPESWNARVGRASDQPTHLTGEEERKDHMRSGSPPPLRVPTENRSH